MNIPGERIDAVTRIAKGIGSGRFRDEVMGEAYLALVEAEADGCSPAEVDRRVRVRCRNIMRRQWTAENRISYVAPKGDVVTTDHTVLWEAIKGLPARQYRAVVLRFWGGLTFAEIGVEMNCSEKAAKGVVGRALGTVQNIFLGQRGFLPCCVRTDSEGEVNSREFSPLLRTNDMLLTLAETARRLGISEKTAREIVRDFPAVKVGKRFRYPADAVAAFAQTPTLPSAPLVRPAA